MKIQMLGYPRVGLTYIYNGVQDHFKNRFGSSALRYDEPFSAVYSKTKNFNKHTIISDLHNLHQPFVAELIHPGTDVIYKHHVAQFEFITPQNIKDLQQCGLYTIVMFRRNLFETALSHTLARMTNIWGRYHLFDYPQQLEVVPCEFKNILHNTILYIDALCENQYQFKYNEVIYYEDLSGNLTDDCDRLEVTKIINSGLSNIETRRFPSPKKESIVVNYNQIIDYYHDMVEVLTPKNFQIENQMIHSLQINNG